MAKTYGFTKTKKIKLLLDKNTEDQMRLTTEQYRQVLAFYSDLAETCKQLTEGDWLGQFEALTHQTKMNPKPKHPLSAIAVKYPSGFRRAAISEAIGAYQSWFTRYDQWKNRKEKQEEKNKKRLESRKKEILFTEKPPTYERKINAWLSYYKTEFNLLDEHHIQLKLFTGKNYAKRKIALQQPLVVPNGYEVGSPNLVQKKTGWFLHIPLILPKKGMKFGTAKERLKAKEGRFCLVDLGMNHHAVCTIQDADGRVYATKFISGKEDNHRRKLYLDKIVHKQYITGIIPKEESFCIQLWKKIRNLNESVAHKVSREIINFALEHRAKTIVFEHLKNLGPQKGRRSHRLNQRYLFWVKGKIVKYTDYKAKHHTIMVNRVSAKDTSRRCPYCGHLSIIRYTESEKKRYGVELAHCTNCKTHAVNSDFIGSLGVGRNFRMKHA